MGDISGNIPLLVLSLAMTLGVGVYAFRLAAGAAVHLFWLITVAEFVWTLGGIMELVSPTAGEKLLWDNLQWPATAMVAPLLLAFSLRFTGTRLRGERLLWPVLSAVAAAMVVLAWTDGWHGLMRSAPRLDPSGIRRDLQYGFRPLHQVVNLIVLGQVLAGLGVIAAHLLRAPRFYRGQVAVILAGASAPLVAGLMAVFDANFGLQRDLLPYSFIVLNACIGWGLFGVRLFDVVPLAREMVIENLADPVVVLDAQDRVVDCNPALRALLADGGRNIVGRSAWDAFAHWPALLDRFRGGDPNGVLPMRRAGDPAWFDIRVMPLTGRHGRPLGRVVIASDITRQKLAELELMKHRDHLEAQVQSRTTELAEANERLRNEMREREGMEQQLLQARKMEALGRLAGGVAHDLNNMLVPILNYTQLVMMKLAEADPMREHLGQVLRAAERAAELARQILAYSRRQVLHLAPVDLNEIVAGMRDMLGRLVGAEIRFSVELPPAPSRIMADRSQLDQIVMNLVVNARDAMPSGGRLVLRVGAMHVSGDDAGGDWIGGRPKEGRNIILEVEDSGEGMDPEVIARIFDPFFTTKPEGKGTGLGLSTVFGIVKQHGGAIRVRTKPGHGSVFTVSFPETDQCPESNGVTAPSAIPVGGDETILVVDDEATVRAIAGHILRGRGYHVIEAASPEEACEIAARSEAPIHLLLTDLIMPGMNGRVMSEKIRANLPDIRVLFISGYSDVEMAERGLLSGGDEFLAKPFSVDSLSAKVREALGRGEGPGTR